MIIGMCLRVVIVDDHARFRAQATELLTLERFTVVGDADTGAGGVELSQALAPDVVLLDVGLPDANGFDLVRGDACHRRRRRAHLQPGVARLRQARRRQRRGGLHQQGELTGEAIRSLLR